MKKTFLLLALACVASAYADEPENKTALAVRDPFWPIGYAGTRAVISAEPRVQADAAAAEESADVETGATAVAVPVAETAEETANRHWAEARKALKTGGVVRVKGADGKMRVSIYINGKPYADGDRISFNFRDRRFTWRVDGLSEGGTLRLVRLFARPLPAASQGEKQ